MKGTVWFNYMMNLLIKLGGGLFSFLSYPYAFRILGAEQIGKVSFASSFSAVFAMIAVLGIPVYGIRECAKVSDDPKRLSALVSELLALQAIATAVALVTFGVGVCLIPQLREEWLLHLVQASVILAGAMNVEWVFTAREEFAYIAARSVAVKALMTLLIFVLVRAEGDYVIYALLLALATVLTNAVNLSRLLRSPWIDALHRPCSITRHITPTFVFFAQTVAITVYTGIDSIMLYLLQGEYATGVYDAAIKEKLLLSYLITGLSTVLMPRMSYYMAKEKQDYFFSTLSVSVQFVVSAAMPLILFFFTMAEESMLIVSGVTDLQGINSFRILLFTVFLIGGSGILGNQILTPTNREKIALYVYLCGATVNVVLNAVLIPMWSLIGAAISTLITEALILGIEIYVLRSDMKRILGGLAWKAPLAAAALPFPILLLIKSTIPTPIPSIFIGGSVYGGMWMAFAFIFKEPVFANLIRKLKR